MILWQDSADHYIGPPDFTGTDTAALAHKWDGFSISSNLLYRPNGGPYNGPYISGVLDLRKDIPLLTLPSAIGFSFWFRTALSSQSENLIGFRNAAGQQHAQIVRMASGAWEARRFGGNVLGVSASHTIREMVWHWMDTFFVLGDVGGEVHLWVDGAHVLNLTGVDTRQDSFGTTLGRINMSLRADQSSLGGSAGFVMWDTTGSKNNAPFGDGRVDYLPAAGNGARTDYTPSAGANWENVDEREPDEDGTHNESLTVGNIDRYTIQPFPTPSSLVRSVSAIARVRSPDATARSSRITLLSGATNTNGPAFATSSTYDTDVFLPIEDDPNTGTDWTEAGVEAVEVGVEDLS